MIDRLLGALGLQRRAPIVTDSQRHPATFRRALPVNVNAAYDAAQTTEKSARNWKYADALSADRANDLTVRKTLRERSRYECLEANSYAKGIVHTLAIDVIGKGPRLHVTTENEEANSIVQRNWHSWARAARFARKLQVMRLSKCVDGEAFGELVTNRRLRHAVQLDLRVTECDQYSTPQGIFDPTRMVDGIQFDEFGNPEVYHRLKYHPGGWGYSYEVDEIPAEEVVHLFRADRPGQHRGIPEVTTSLPLFQHLRRYTLATIAAAETSAKLTAVMQTPNILTLDSSGNPVNPNVKEFDHVDIDYDTITALPEGYTLNAFDPKQPITSYDDFVRAILREIARPLHMTAVIALGDASGTSYSGGRLDVQTYQQAIENERAYWEEECLDRVLSAWFDEAVLAGLIPGDIGHFDELPHQWVWDNREHVDPAKVAVAADKKLRNGLTHREREYALHGMDVDEEDAKASRSFGLTVDEYRRRLADGLLGVSVQSTDEETDADELPIDSAKTSKGVPT